MFFPSFILFRRRSIILMCLFCVEPGLFSIFSFLPLTGDTKGWSIAFIRRDITVLLSYAMYVQFTVVALNPSARVFFFFHLVSFSFLYARLIIISLCAAKIFVPFQRWKWKKKVNFWNETFSISSCWKREHERAYASVCSMLIELKLKQINHHVLFYYFNMVKIHTNRSFNK